VKKVLFFTEDEWAFGSVHHALNKVLYKEGIYSNLLNWRVQYTYKEFELLNNVYDVFVTTPEIVYILRDYGVPLNKIIAIAHGQRDILLGKLDNKFDFYSELKGFGVISEVLKSKCAEWNISVVPDVVELGIHFDLFHSTLSKKLSIIGHGNPKREIFNQSGIETKRSKLIPVIINGIEGVELKKHEQFKFFCMPAFYREIDCLIMPSIEEAGGLPVMEAAAAGRLVMGTPVGYFEHNAKKGGGILLPLEENDFIQSAKRNIIFYRDNPKEYQRKCLEIQEFARYNYDWSYKIGDWVTLLNK